MMYIEKRKAESGRRRRMAVIAPVCELPALPPGCRWALNGNAGSPAGRKFSTCDFLLNSLNIFSEPFL